ncbi:MAG TPA: hypothetical protein VG873_10185 [Burkholderiales bacterium]|nr:hypothetical protein [Burkholderiales bacterium]
MPARCPPVLILAFNRPDLTRRALAAVQAARPAAVYFAVDGARAGKAGEHEAVQAVQELAQTLDGCAVHTLFREQNLGCKLAVSQAISWFFEQVEEGIVMEDDCVAHPSFFHFAAELLERYRDDERVMMISGDNFQKGPPRTPYSYYFSRYTHIWGWASWRRAWRLYDHAMSAWPELRDGDWLMDVLGDRDAVTYWTRIFDQTHGERNTSWGYRWMFAAFRNSGLTVLPNVNLVSNIGFGAEGTHNRATDDPHAALSLQELPFPLRHPPFVIRDGRADALTQGTMFANPSLLRSAARRARGLLRRILHGQ